MMTGNSVSKDRFKSYLNAQKRKNRIREYEKHPIELLRDFCENCHDSEISQRLARLASKLIKDFDRKEAHKKDKKTQGRILAEYFASSPIKGRKEANHDDIVKEYLKLPNNMKEKEKEAYLEEKYYLGKRNIQRIIKTAKESEQEQQTIHNYIENIRSELKLIEAIMKENDLSFEDIKNVGIDSLINLNSDKK